MTAASTTTTTTTHSSTTTMPPWCRPDAGSNCPAEDHWLDLMVQMDPAPGKVFVDVGCNKGNDIIALMERYDQSHHWSTAAYIAKLQTRNLARFICDAQPPKVKIRDMKNRSAVASFPVGVCVEPMPTTTKVLRDVGNELGYNESVNYHVVQAAVVQEANPGQTIQMKLVEAGNEGSTLGAKDGTMAKVPAMTLDGIVATFGLHRIDMLHIDVEGWDPDVLFGGKRILESTRYMMFEVHRDIANSGVEPQHVEIGRGVAGHEEVRMLLGELASHPHTGRLLVRRLGENGVVERDVCQSVGHVGQAVPRDVEEPETLSRQRASAW
eukprot:CAMPEP_0168371178 /NCGR_PEP_ID=MMETSP0228-20121227/7640_1 /TAXON_ID=133427 /ORGANISM="Protoceratium reticulatum, Strain CCCM 535 (=CCMP 1889)" /LENGTH=323 /DNA_ID=CAMNT_0008384063 /DNA_START=167 /DNA_END=1134 /DNA_ORIENTATION=-